MTSLKWWISASMLVASSWRGGSAYLRSSVMYGPSGRPSSACRMMREDSFISSIRTIIRSQLSPTVPTGILKSKSS